MVGSTNSDANFQCSLVENSSFIWLALHAQALPGVLQDLSTLECRNLVVAIGGPMVGLRQCIHGFRQPSGILQRDAEIVVCVGHTLSVLKRFHAQLCFPKIGKTAKCICSLLIFPQSHVRVPK